jgi:hypothetical protein
MVTAYTVLYIFSVLRKPHISTALFTFISDWISAAFQLPIAIAAPTFLGF